MHGHGGDSKRSTNPSLETKDGPGATSTKSSEESKNETEISSSQDQLHKLPPSLLKQNLASMLSIQEEGSLVQTNKEKRKDLAQHLITRKLEYLLKLRELLVKEAIIDEKNLVALPVEMTTKDIQHHVQDLFKSYGPALAKRLWFILAVPHIKPHYDLYDLITFVCDSDQGSSFLESALLQKKYDIAKLFINHGAKFDKNWKNWKIFEDKKIPIEYINMLVSQDASFLPRLLQNLSDDTAYFWLLQLFPFKDIDPKAMNNALTIAFNQNKLKSMEILLKQNMDPNQIDEHGETLLGKATGRYDPNTVKLLLHFGANPYLINLGGNSPGLCLQFCKSSDAQRKELNDIYDEWVKKQDPAKIQHLKRQAKEKVVANLIEHMNKCFNEIINEQTDKISRYSNSDFVETELKKLNKIMDLKNFHHKFIQEYNPTTHDSDKTFMHLSKIIANLNDVLKRNKDRDSIRYPEVIMDTLTANIALTEVSDWFLCLQDRILLGENTHAPHPPSSSQVYPLHKAAKNGYVGTLTYWLERLDDPDVVYPGSILPTPLSLAVTHHNFECVKLLLQHGANPFLIPAFMKTKTLFLLVGGTDSKDREGHEYGDIKKRKILAVEIQNFLNTWLASQDKTALMRLEKEAEIIFAQTRLSAKQDEKEVEKKHNVFDYPLYIQLENYFKKYLATLQGEDKARLAKAHTNFIQNCGQTPQNFRAHVTETINVIKDIASRFSIGWQSHFWRGSNEHAALTEIKVLEIAIESLSKKSQLHLWPVETVFVKTGPF